MARNAAKYCDGRFSMFDQAAITTVRGLGAVPAPPPELHATLRPFAVPIAYRLQ